MMPNVSIGSADILQLDRNRILVRLAQRKKRAYRVPDPSTALLFESWGSGDQLEVLKEPYSIILFYLFDQRKIGFYSAHAIP